MGSLFCCLVTLSVKKVFLFLYFHLCPLPLFLSPGTTEKICPHLCQVVGSLEPSLLKGELLSHCQLLVHQESLGPKEGAELISSQSAPFLHWCMELLLPGCRIIMESLNLSFIPEVPESSKVWLVPNGQ